MCTFKHIKVRDQIKLYIKQRLLSSNLLSGDILNHAVAVDTTSDDDTHAAAVDNTDEVGETVAVCCL